MIEDIRRHTLSMYNELFHYYTANIGKTSKYARVVITEELIDKLQVRRNELLFRRAASHG